MPSNTEEHVQEIGRAGRDGQPAKGNLIHVWMIEMHNCTNILGILLFSEADIQHALYWCKGKLQRNCWNVLMKCGGK